MAKGDQITTRFKCDISDLKRGIAQANQQIKLANAQFKAATAGMDDWSKSADGIRAKLAQLDSTIQAQKSKVEVYREQLKRQEEAYKTNGERAAALRDQMQKLAYDGVDKTSKEYKILEQQLAAAEKEQESNAKSVDNLRIQVLDAEAAVSKSEKEYKQYSEALRDVGEESDKSAKETDDLGESVKESGENAENASDGFSVMKGALGDLVSKGIQLAVQALKDMAKAAVEAWNAFDDGRDVVVKLTGATGDFAKKVTTAYANVSRKIVADSDEVGKAVGEVSTRFGLEGDALESFSLAYLKFAQITDSDVVTAIDNTQKALSAYGLDVNSTKKLLDALAATSQKTGVDTDTLTKGLVSNATAFEEMGLSIEQSVEFMGQLETSGANTETVMSGLRKALKNSTTDGKTLSSALVELENEIVNTQDSTKGLTAAYDVFGKSGDQIYGAIKNGSLSFADIAEAASNAAGTVENTFESTRDVTDEFQLAVTNLKVSVAEAIDDFIQQNGDKLIPLMESLTGDGIPALIDAIVKIGDVLVWLSEHIEEIKKFVKTNLDIVTFWAKLLVKDMKWCAEKIIGAWEKLKPFFENLWAAIKGIFEKAPAWFAARWEDIKNVFSGVGEWFSEKFTTAWENIKKAFSKVGEFFGGLWETIKSKFSSLGTKIGDAIGGSVKSALNYVIYRIETIINNGINLINGAINLINKIPGVSIGSVARLNLPRLAKGGVLEKGQIGLLEGSGAEAVVPLENNKKWIAAVAAAMSSEMVRSSVNNDYNFTQNIYSPKPLNRYEIYRQTRNQLNFAKLKAGV